MPKGFAMCVEKGGKVRRVSGPSKEHGLKEGEYINYCMLNGETHRGEVKKTEKEHHQVFRSENAEINLLEEGLTKIQVIPAGQWNHPEYGKIVYDEDRINRIIQNFKNGVFKALPVDIEHKSNDGAVGWIKDLKFDGEFLYAYVEFTEEGKKYVSDKKYPFFSAEIWDQWEDPKTGEVYKDLLRGGAITTRPFMQEMDQIVLSEKYSMNYQPINKQKKGGEEQMDIKALKAKLQESPVFKLGKDATKEEKKAFREAQSELLKEYHEKIAEGKAKEDEQGKKATDTGKIFKELGIETVHDARELANVVKEAKKIQLREQLKDHVLPKNMDAFVNFAFSLKTEAQVKEFVDAVKSQEINKLFKESGKPMSNANKAEIKLKGSDLVDATVKKLMSEKPDQFKTYSDALKEVSEDGKTVKDEYKELV